MHQFETPTVLPELQEQNQEKYQQKLQISPLQKLKQKSKKSKNYYSSHLEQLDEFHEMLFDQQSIDIQHIPDLNRYINYDNNLGYTLIYHLTINQEFNNLFQIFQSQHLDHQSNIIYNLLKGLIKIKNNKNVPNLIKFLKQLAITINFQSLLKNDNKWDCLNLLSHFDLSNVQDLKLYKCISKCFHLNQSLYIRAWLDHYHIHNKIPKQNPNKCTHLFLKYNIFHSLVDQKQWDQFVANYSQLQFAQDINGISPFAKFLSDGPMQHIVKYCQGNRENVEIQIKKMYAAKNNLSLLHLLLQNKDEIDLELLKFINQLIGDHRKIIYKEQYPIGTYLIIQRRYYNQEIINYLQINQEQLTQFIRLYTLLLGYYQKKNKRKYIIKNEKLLMKLTDHYYGKVQIAKLQNNQVDDYSTLLSYIPYNFGSSDASFINLLIRKQEISKAEQTLRSYLSQDLIINPELLEFIEQFIQENKLKFNVQQLFMTDKIIQLISLYQEEHLNSNFKQLIQFELQQIINNNPFILELELISYHQYKYMYNYLIQFEWLKLNPIQDEKLQFNILIEGIIKNQLRHQKFIELTQNIQMQNQQITIYKLLSVYNQVNINISTLEIYVSMNSLIPKKIEKILELLVKDKRYMHNIINIKEGYLLIKQSLEYIKKNIYCSQTQWIFDYFNKQKIYYFQPTLSQFKQMLFQSLSGQEVTISYLSHFKNMKNVEPTCIEEEIILTSINNESNVLSVLVSSDKYINLLEQFLSNKTNWRYFTYQYKINYLAHALFNEAYTTLNFLKQFIQQNIINYQSNSHQYLSTLFYYSSYYINQWVQRNFEKENIQYLIFCSDWLQLNYIKKTLQGERLNKFQRGFEYFVTLFKEEITQQELQETYIQQTFFYKQNENYLLRLIYPFLSIEQLNKVPQQLTKFMKRHLYFSISDILYSDNLEEKNLYIVDFIFNNLSNSISNTLGLLANDSRNVTKLIQEKLIQNFTQSNLLEILIPKYLTRFENPNFDLIHDKLLNLNLKTPIYTLIYSHFLKQKNINGLYYMLHIFSVKKIQLKLISYCQRETDEFTNFALSAFSHWSLGLNDKQILEFIKVNSKYINELERLKPLVYWTYFYRGSKLRLVKEWIGEYSKDLFSVLLYQKLYQYRVCIGNDELVDYFKLDKTNQKIAEIAETLISFKLREVMSRGNAASTDNKQQTSFHNCLFDTVDEISSFEECFKLFEELIPIDQIKQNLCLFQAYLFFRPQNIDFDIGNLIINYENRESEFRFSALLLKVMQMKLNQDKWNQYIQFIEFNFKYFTPLNQTEILLLGYVQYNFYLDLVRKYNQFNSSFQTYWECFPKPKIQLYNRKEKVVDSRKIRQQLLEPFHYNQNTEQIKQNLILGNIDNVFSLIQNLKNLQQIVIECGILQYFIIRATDEQVIKLSKILNVELLPKESFYYKGQPLLSHIIFKKMYYTYQLFEKQLANQWNEECILLQLKSCDSSSKIFPQEMNTIQFALLNGFYVNLNDNHLIEYITRTNQFSLQPHPYYQQMMAYQFYTDFVKLLPFVYRPYIEIVCLYLQYSQEQNQPIEQRITLICHLLCQKTIFQQKSFPKLNQSTIELSTNPEYYLISNKCKTNILNLFSILFSFNQTAITTDIEKFCLKLKYQGQKIELAQLYELANRYQGIYHPINSLLFQLEPKLFYNINTLGSLEYTVKLSFLLSEQEYFKYFDQNNQLDLYPQNFQIMKIIISIRFQLSYPDIFKDGAFNQQIYIRALKFVQTYNQSFNLTPQMIERLSSLLYNGDDFKYVLTTIHDKYEHLPAIQCYFSMIVEIIQQNLKRYEIVQELLIKSNYLLKYNEQDVKYQEKLNITDSQIYIPLNSTNISESCDSFIKNQDSKFQNKINEMLQKEIKQNRKLKFEIKIMFNKACKDLYDDSRWQLQNLIYHQSLLFYHYTPNTYPKIIEHKNIQVISPIEAKYVENLEFNWQNLMEIIYQLENQDNSELDGEFSFTLSGITNYTKLIYDLISDLKGFYAGISNKCFYNRWFISIKSILNTFSFIFKDTHSQQQFYDKFKLLLKWNNLINILRQVIFNLEKLDITDNDTAVYIQFQYDGQQYPNYVENYLDTIYSFGKVDLQLICQIANVNIVIGEPSNLKIEEIEYMETITCLENSITPQKFIELKSLSINNLLQEKIQPKIDDNVKLNFDIESFQKALKKYDYEGSKNILNQLNQYFHTKIKSEVQGILKNKESMGILQSTPPLKEGFDFVRVGFLKYAKFRNCFGFEIPSQYIQKKKLKGNIWILYQSENGIQEINGIINRTSDEWIKVGEKTIYNNQVLRSILYFKLWPHTSKTFLSVTKNIYYVDFLGRIFKNLTCPKTIKVTNCASIKQLKQEENIEINIQFKEKKEKIHNGQTIVMEINDNKVRSTNPQPITYELTYRAYKKLKQFKQSIMSLALSIYKSQDTYFKECIVDIDFAFFNFNIDSIFQVLQEKQLEIINIFNEILYQKCPKLRNSLLYLTGVSLIELIKEKLQEYQFVVKFTQGTEIIQTEKQNQQIVIIFNKVHKKWNSNLNIEEILSFLGVQSLTQLYFNLIFPKISVLIDIKSIEYDSALNMPYQLKNQESIMVSHQFQDFSLIDLLYHYHDFKELPYTFISQLMVQREFTVKYQFQKQIDPTQLILVGFDGGVPFYEYCSKCTDQICEFKITRSNGDKVLLFLYYDGNLIGLNSVQIINNQIEEFINQQQSLNDQRFYIMFEDLDESQDLEQQLNILVEQDDEPITLQQLLKQNKIIFINRTSAFLTLSYDYSTKLKLLIKNHFRINLQTTSTEEELIIYFKGQIDYNNIKYLGVENQHQELIASNQQVFPNKPSKFVKQFLNSIQDYQFDEKKLLEICTRAGDERIDQIELYDIKNRQIQMGKIKDAIFQHTQQEDIFYQANILYESKKIRLQWYPIIKGIYNLIIDGNKLKNQILILANQPYIENCKFLSIRPSINQLYYLTEYKIEIELKDKFNNSLTSNELLKYNDQSKVEIKIQPQESISIVSNQIANGKQVLSFKIEPFVLQPLDQAQNKQSTLSIFMDSVLIFQNNYELRAVVQLKLRREQFCNNIPQIRGIERLYVKRDDFLASLQQSMLAVTNFQVNFKVEFAGEAAYDQGGPLREFYELVGQEMKQFLFQVPNGTYYLKKGELSDKMGILYGILVAHSFLANMYIGIGFAVPFWKIFLGKNLTFEDLGEILEKTEYENYKRLQSQSDEELSQLDLNFTFGMEELIQEGQYIKVDKQNVRQYLDYLAIHILENPFKEFFENFRKGFNSVFDSNLLSKYFIIHEINDFLKGNEYILFEDMLKLFIFKGDEDMKDWWIQYLKEGDQEKWKKILKFIYGSSYIRDDLDQLIVDFHKYSSQKMLPVASTCAKRIRIPKYENYETFKSKMDQALEYGSDHFGLR